MPPWLSHSVSFYSYLPLPHCYQSLLSRTALTAAVALIAADTAICQHPACALLMLSVLLVLCQMPAGSSEIFDVFSCHFVQESVKCHVTVLWPVWLEECCWLPLLSVYVSVVYLHVGTTVSYELPWWSSVWAVLDASLVPSATISGVWLCILFSCQCVWGSDCVILIYVTTENLIDCAILHL